MKKISLIIVSAMLFMSSMAFAEEAQVTTAVSVSPTNANIQVQTKLELEEEIKKAIEYKKELISNVKNGVLSEEDARKRWAEKISELRVKKEAFFQERIRGLEVKKEKLNEIAPEIAKKIEERLKITKERRERVEKIRAELRDDIKSGKVDRSELKKRVQSVKKEIEAKRDSFLKEFKIQKVNIKDEFKKRIAEMRVREDLQDQIKLEQKIKNKINKENNQQVQAGKSTRDEAVSGNLERKKEELKRQIQEQKKYKEQNKVDKLEEDLHKQIQRKEMEKAEKKNMNGNK